MANCPEYDRAFAPLQKVVVIYARETSSSEADVDHLFFQLRMPVHDYQGDVHRLIVTAPRSAVVDAVYVLRAMQDIFGEQEWTEIQGPDSRWIPHPER